MLSINTITVIDYVKKLMELLTTSSKQAVIISAVLLNNFQMRYYYFSGKFAPNHLHILISTLVDKQKQKSNLRISLPTIGPDYCANFDCVIHLPAFNFFLNPVLIQSPADQKGKV